MVTIKTLEIHLYLISKTLPVITAVIMQPLPMVTTSRLSSQVWKLNLLTSLQHQLSAHCSSIITCVNRSLNFTCSSYYSHSLLSILLIVFISSLLYICQFSSMCITPKITTCGNEITQFDFDINASTSILTELDFTPKCEGTDK